MTATLCLNMIVRNEAHIIAATLDDLFAKVPIDCAVIHDTGSTDGTADIVRQALDRHGIAGDVRCVDWVNFAHNRNLALDDASGRADYVLFFDADDQVEGTLVLPDLTADGYTLNLRRNTNVFARMLIVRNDGSYHWRGVVHEGLYWRGNRAERLEHVSGDYVVLTRSLGGRSLDPSTYYKDAKLLEAELLAPAPADPDLAPRYAFYCANSYRDAKCHREALHWYRTRITMDGWMEEVYLSYLGAGLALEEIGDRDEACTMLLAGHDVAPDRRECVYHLSRILRGQARFASALLFAEAGLKIPRPPGNRLFVWDSIYDYWMDYEYLFLKKKTGTDPKSLPQYERFMTSAADDAVKATLR